jgi:hypothetical protein
MLNALLFVSKIQEATTSLVDIDFKIIQISPFLQVIANKERQNFEFLMFEIEERMKLLKVIARRNAMVYATASIADLSKAEDISAAFDFAINAPRIDWLMA